MTGLAAGASEPEERAHFRPDLEGLRAVAVALVMAFHASVPRLSGGYIGVDVFYVLSGFLITGLLLRELERNGAISMAAFYARRARRLLPAAAFVLVVTVIASAVLLPPLRLRDITADAIAAALYVVNLRFAVQATDYIAADFAPSPLLHYWSLAVEEQFYLVWPLLLLIALRIGRRSVPVHVRVGVAVVAVGLLSFAASLWLTRTAEPWAFYTLPARAWELAIGGVLAVIAARGLVLPRLAATAAGAAGLAMIVAAATLYHLRTPFPGTAALLPTFGAALVIVAGLGGSRSFPSRLLGLPPVRFFGRISYSLYLWHWPMIVIPVSVVGPWLELRYRILLAALTIPLAWATTRWVEDPIRRGALARAAPRRTLALAGALSVGVILVTVNVAWWAPIARPVLAFTGATGPAPSLAPGEVGGGLERVLGTPRQAGVPAPPAGPVPRTVGGPVPPDLRPPLDAVRKDVPVIYSSGCNADTEEITAPSCVFGDRDSATTVMLIGDSHAAQWFGAFERLATEQGWRLVAHTKAACAFVDHPVWLDESKRPYPECTAWGREVMAVLVRERPALVVLAHSRYHLLIIDGEPVAEAHRPDIWDAALMRTIGEVQRHASRVAILGDTPQAVLQPADCLSAAHHEILVCSLPRQSALADVRHGFDLAVAQQSGAAFIDPDPFVCPSEPCPPIIGSTLVYRDSTHLTNAFMVAVAPYLLPELPPLE